MKNKFTILGCGSSLGSPWITNHRGNLTNNLKNIRSRCCAHIQYKNLSILIDTSPDIKSQFLKNKIKDISSVIFSHEHADQTNGLFELRPFFWKNKKQIKIFANKETLRTLKEKHDYCFFGGQGYIPILKGNLIKKNF